MSRQKTFTAAIKKRQKRQTAFSEFNTPFGVDRHLFRADIRVNIAEAAFQRGILTRLETDA